MAIYGIFGSGGFGREVMPVARQMLAARGRAAGDRLVFVESSAGPHAPVNGVEVIGQDEFLGTAGERFFNIAIADSRLRERIAGAAEAAGARPFSIVSPQALDLDANDIGEGAILCPFTMVTANARIGRYFHANIYSYVAHDTVIGDFVTFAPGVKCNGRVVIEDHAYVGTGVVIKHGGGDKPTVIGRGAVVGMGAVVTKDVPAGATVVGNPARPLERR